MNALKLVQGSVLAFALSLIVLPLSAFAAVGTPLNLAVIGGATITDTTPTFTWTPGAGATWYDYHLDNNAFYGIGNVFSYTVSAQSLGWHTFYLRSHNNAGEVSGITSVTFDIVVAPVATLAAPSYLALSGGSPTTDTTPAFTWTRANGATWYDYKIDNGSYYGIGNVSSFTTGTLSMGWHTFYLRSHDNSGNISGAVYLTFEIKSISTLSAPTNLTNISYSINNTPTFTWTAANGATWYDVSVDSGSYVGIGNVTSYTTSTLNHGWHTLAVRAHDNSGRVSSAASYSFNVGTYQDAIPTSYGKLIKIHCTDESVISDPCKAVYYYSNDGQRHAFPNESIYYTWYTNFGSVVEISSSAMGAIPLGKNVTYHPGSKLVEFASIPKVFAVSRYGVLHEYQSQSLIAGDYGSAWTSYVVIVPESLYTNYTVGYVIDSSSDYDMSTALNSVSSVGDNF